MLSPSLSVSPRRKNVQGALANVHEWSPSLLSPTFVEQVATKLDGLSSSLIIQVKFANSVIARSTGQANICRAQ